MKSYFYIITHLLVVVLTSVAMEQTTDVTNPQSVAFLNNNNVAIAGDGCTIFETQSRKPICRVTEKKVFNIAANKDKTLLALSTENGMLLYNTTTGKQTRPSKHIDTKDVFIAFSAFDDTLFSFKNPTLLSCDCINNTVIKNTIPSTYAEIVAYNFISCHPTNNEIICSSGFQKLSIVQPGKNFIVKAQPTTDFHCASGDYAPDGHTVALLSIEEKKKRNCFIYDLDCCSKSTAWQLAANNKNYCASTFHPHNSIIFLLSIDGYVDCFNYIKRMLIATTKNLNIKSINCTQERKRLDCDQYGKQLVAAFADTWASFDIPQNNLLYIRHALLHQIGLPVELIKIILLSIIASHEQSYDCFNFKALFGVTPIKHAVAKQTIENSTEMTAHYTIFKEGQAPHYFSR